MGMVTPLRDTVDMSTVTARHAVLPTRLGELTVVADDDVVTAIYFPGHWTRPKLESLGRAAPAGDVTLAAMGAEVAAYLDGDLRDFATPWRADGTDFERGIWARLRQIGYGETTTYGDIARACGNPHLAQEVGRVVGHNPLSIVVPCHRVIGSDGSLTGYAGGLERKAYLLDLERYLTGQTLLDPR